MKPDKIQVLIELNLLEKNVTNWKPVRNWKYSRSKYLIEGQTKKQIENLFSKFNIQIAGISERGKKEK